MARFKVCIECPTYNHEEYIEATMHGFVKQKTSFPFVAIIIDDASQDRTANVIMQYLKDNFSLEDKEGGFVRDLSYGQVSFAQHSTNRNCFFYVVLLNKNLYSQPELKSAFYQDVKDRSCYVAICEGDDYWTDSMKLQKQVDFLDTHPDYSMCFHKVSVLCNDNEKWIFSHVREGDYSAREIYDDWVVPTCSIVYRLSAHPCLTNPNLIYTDTYILLQLAESGKLYCMGFTGAVYRRHFDSLSCGYSAQTCVRLYHQYKFLERRFPELKDISRRKQETQGLMGIIHAPYFPGIWKYRFLYMFRHPRLFFSSFLTTTILSYTPLRNHKIWKKKRK